MSEDSKNAQVPSSTRSRPKTADPSVFRMLNLFWIGLAVFCAGTGPLLVVILLAKLGITSDPNPNPVGLGILAFLTFLPSIALMFAGLIAAAFRYRAFKRKR